ncbi:MAG: hypothetical protein AAF497_01535 [Planctomycetota bacterium]
MSDDLRTLARAYADGMITESQLQRLEVLLQSDAEARQQYLQELNLINTLEDLAIAPQSQFPSVGRSTKVASVLNNTKSRVTYVCAVLLLVAIVVILNGGGTQSAMAAVVRSIDVAAEMTTRKYQIQIERRMRGETETSLANLYVRGSDRFALQHPSPLLPGRSVWLGKDDVESWIVPAIGPVLKGDHTLHRRWTRDELDIPDMDISSLLTRMMSSGYRLEAMSDEEISVSDGHTFVCQHIRAERETAEQPNLPMAIELWASRESGIAVKIFARWALADDDSGKKSAVLSFQGEQPNLSATWFTAEAHEGRRSGPSRDDVDH